MLDRALCLRVSARALLCVSTLVAPACTSSADDGGAAGGGAAGAGGAGEAGVPSLSAGGYTLSFDEGAASITLARGATALLTLPADALALGTLPTLADDFNYDPLALVTHRPLQPPPADLAWLSVEAFVIDSATADAVTATLTYTQGKKAKLTAKLVGTGRWDLTLVPDAAGPAVAYMRVAPHVDAKERFYGLGEYYDTSNHRGKVRAMQLEQDARLESSYNEAHVPVPFVIGTTGWGLFVESPYPGAFEVATVADDVVRATFGTGLASKDGLAFHLYAADRPLDLTKLYYDTTAYPKLPARWALGPWIWRDENVDQAQVEGDLQAIRDNDLAVSGVWIDRPYATGVETFDFRPSQFPAPQAMLDRFHDLGFRSAIWHTPYLDEKDTSTQALRDEAKAKGYYPSTVGVALNKWGDLLDLTNPDMVAWWQAKLRAYTDAGIEGFKLDYGEDVVPGLTNGRNTWAFHDGSDERTQHSRFQLFYHRTYAAMLPADGGFLLCRHATYGDQANGPIIWPGDLDVSFARQGDVIDDATGKYTAVGGLPASLVAGLSLGPSGFPFYAADTGGYRHVPPDKELLLRWSQQTALSTVMEIGNSASTVPWELDAATGIDAEAVGVFRTYARLHMRLFPYVWTYAQSLAKDGRAIVRPLGLAFPELDAETDDAYLFGDALLVAPIVDRGKTSRELVLPPGTWLDFDTGVAFDGGKLATLDAPLAKLPLLLASGGIVAMLRPTIDTLAPTTHPDTIDSYATTPGVLWARIAAGSSSSVTLFDGATLAQSLDAGTLTLTAGDGSEFKAGTHLEVLGLAAKPAGVSEGAAAIAEAADAAALDAATSGWRWDAAGAGVLHVKLPAGAHTVTAR